MIDHETGHVLEPECGDCGAVLAAGCDCAARAALVLHAVDTWGWDPFDKARWPSESERRAWLERECADEGIEPVMFEPWDRDVASLAAERARTALDDLDEEVARHAAYVLDGMGLGAPAEHFDLWGDDERPCAAEE